MVAPISANTIHETAMGTLLFLIVLRIDRREKAGFVDSELSQSDCVVPAMVFAEALQYAGQTRPLIVFQYLVCRWTEQSAKLPSLSREVSEDLGITCQSREAPGVTIRWLKESDRPLAAGESESD
jgi:hypothetical protein